MRSTQQLVADLRAKQQAGAREELDKLLAERPEAGDSDDSALRAIVALVHAIREERGQAVALLESIDSGDVANSPHALSDMGLASLLVGRGEAAERLLIRAIEFAEPDPAAFARLGAIEMARGQLERAEDRFYKCLERLPDKPEVLSNLAGIRVRQNRLDEALELYNRALRLDPGLDRANAARGRIYQMLGRIDELIDEAREAVENDPDSPELRQKHAAALSQADRNTEAEQVLAAAIETFPDTFSLRLAFGRLLASERKWWKLGARLLAWLDEARFDADERASLRTMLNRARIEAGFLDAAETDLDSVPEDERQEPGWSVTRARLLNERGRTEEGIAVLREVVESYPGLPEAHTLLAHMLTLLGRTDEARVHQNKLARLSPEALATYVEARDERPSADELETLETLRTAPTLARDSRAAVSFSLARILDRQGRYDDAFHVLAEGNELVREAIDYDWRRHRWATQMRLRQFDHDLVGQFDKRGSPSPRPIFVVGMPRSGTTLTEQILASHPDVFGAGELSTVNRITRLMPKVIRQRIAYPAAMRYLTDRNLRSAAEYYLEEIAKLDDAAGRVVDKLPHNFDHVGLIALMFPNARIIHLKRDPRDVAVSNYFQNYATARGLMGFAYDLADIGHMLNDHDRIMAHWHKILPERIYELEYERLVSDPETEVARLLEHCGLDWDDSVMRFYETERPVKTASVRQVREGFYTTSTEKWRRYEGHLGPLEDVLAEGFQTIEAPAPKKQADEGPQTRDKAATWAGGT